VRITNEHERMKKNRRALTALVILIASVACSRQTAERPSSAASPAPSHAPLATFPPLGPATRVEKGVMVHQVLLGATRVWIYLPEKPPGPAMPVVFIAPAGVPPFVGNGFGPDLDRQQHPEHLPYVHAGFAVVAYDTAGELPSGDEPTDEQVQAAATAFRDAEAGVVNARHAIDYVVKMVPGVDPKRLYSAGHSSAGRISLLLAESDPRIAACVAYAPVTNPDQRAWQNAPEAARYLEANVSGFREFLKRTSPIRNVGRLRCPTFLYHAEDDTRISILETEQFVESLKKTNPRVTFVRGARGDHYDSMIEEGMPKAIAWLRGLE
jgi:dipeptidyl aminopeptidase/acylaminoacyl peptidase